jgi:hypothetical protein
MKIGNENGNWEWEWKVITCLGWEMKKRYAIAYAKSPTSLSKDKWWGVGFIGVGWG